MRQNFEILFTVAMEYMESGSAEIAIRTMLSFLAILNIAGNSLVCMIIIKNQDMRYAKGNRRAICVHMSASAEREFAQNGDGYSSASL